MEFQEAKVSIWWWGSSGFAVYPLNETKDSAILHRDETAEGARQWCMENGYTVAEDVSINNVTPDGMENLAARVEGDY